MKIAKIDNYTQSNIFASKFTKKDNRSTNTNHTTRNINPANVLLDKNYASLQIKKSNNISFKGLPSAPKKQLGESVGNLFNVLRSNDLIVVAPDVKNAINAVNKHVDSLKVVIKRMFYIEDKALKQPLAFRKNLNEREMVNLSDNLVFIKDAKNQMVPLKSGEAGYILASDTIKAGEKEFSVANHPETNLPIKDSFTTFIDFNNEVEPSIKELNKRTLKKLQKEQTGQNYTAPVTFKDVGGQDAVIKELKKNILFPIKHPELNNGGKGNKSILLYGPPGTGKSLIAEATANESGSWYRKINASELDNKYVGGTEENWVELFKEASENQPAIIFIDEFDAIAKKRGGHDVYGDKALNTILGLMTKAKNEDIYMIAATNNRKALDLAATRSGRFGIALEVKEPDLKGTKQILNIHTKNQPLDKDFNADKIAEALHKERSTGADIEAISVEARNNALEREMIFEKMDNGTYTKTDLDNLRIKTEDFEKAIETFKASRQENLPKPRKPVGFRHYD